MIRVVRHCFWAAAVAAVLATAATAGAAELELRAACRPERTGGHPGRRGQGDRRRPAAGPHAGGGRAVSHAAGRRNAIRRHRQIQDLLYLHGVNPVEHRFSGASRVMISTTGRARLLQRPCSRPAVEGAAERIVQTQTGPVVVVAAHALPRGAVIAAGDVRLDAPKPDSTPADAISAVEDVLGQQTTRTIAAGQVFSAGSVEPPTLVRRGEIVSVCVRRPGIRVRSSARARDDGGLGDVVGVGVDRRPQGVPGAGQRPARGRGLRKRSMRNGRQSENRTVTR